MTSTSPKRPADHSGWEVLRRYGVVARNHDLLEFVRRKTDYAIAANFIMDRDGIIRWRYLGKNFHDRPTAGKSSGPSPNMYWANDRPLSRRRPTL